MSWEGDTFQAVSVTHLWAPWPLLPNSLLFLATHVCFPLWPNALWCSSPVDFREWWTHPSFNLITLLKMPPLHIATFWGTGVRALTYGFGQDTAQTIAVTHLWVPWKLLPDSLLSLGTHVHFLSDYMHSEALPAVDFREQRNGSRAQDSFPHHSWQKSRPERMTLVSRESTSHPMEQPWLAYPCLFNSIVWRLLFKGFLQGIRQGARTKM